MSNFIDNLAPLFDETKSYSVGDKFLYNDMLYKVKTAFSGSFDASKVKELYLSQIMGSSESSDFECIAQEWDGSESYSANDFVMHDGKLYVSIDGTSANTFIDSEWKRVYLADVRKYTGFSFKTWLSKGGVTKTFTDLSSVLSDEETVRRLMTIHDSADYLVENISKNTSLLTTITTSATAMKWIGLRDYVCDNLMKVADVKTAMLSSDNWEYILKDHVPVMTSNTAPYGECDNDTVYGNQYAYYAFDNNASTYWESTNTAYPHHVSYKFTNPICVKKFSISSNVVNTQSSVKTIVIEGCNDGSSYAPIDTVTASDTTSKQTFSINNDDYFMYYRAKFTDSYESGYNYSIVSSLQFYGRSLNVSVPTMTSNTAPWGEAIRDTVYNSSLEAYNVFNGDDSDTTLWAQSDGFNQGYIGYKFNKHTLCKFAILKQKSTVVRITSFKVQGLMDNNNWEDITETITVSSYISLIPMYNNNKVYKGYRIYILNKNVTNGANVRYLNFYGVDYSEREFESGSTMKYIYDHGVELETVTTYPDSGGIITKNDDNIYMYNSQLAETHFYSSTIDLSDYSIVRACIDDEYIQKVVLNIGNSPIIYSTALKIIDTTDMPNNLYLDISSVSNSLACGIKNNTAGAKIKINEWWLE